MSRSGRVFIAVTLAGSLLSLASAASASAAPAKGAVYAPNGMVGVAQQIAIQAPALKGQTVTVGFANGPLGSQAQTTIGANGYGNVTWTPSAAGTWQISGLGNAYSLTPTSISVAAQPTTTAIVAGNNLQWGAPTTINVFVSAQSGTVAPQGTISVTSTFGSPVGSATLTPYSGFGTSNVSVGTFTWIPSAALTNYPMVASYTPASGAWAASQSPTATPMLVPNNPVVSLRFAPALYVNQPTYLSLILGQGYGNGSAAFIVNNQTIGGSVPVTNGTASVPWTPSVAGNATIVVQYTSNTGQSGQSTQGVNILGSLPVDNVTVDPPGQPVWSQGRAIVMQAGSSVTLAATTSSGAPVLFSEQGPCVINGSALIALSTGACTVSAYSPGSPAYTAVTENYVVTVTAAPAKKRG